MAPRLALVLLCWALSFAHAKAEAIRVVVISDLNGSYGSTEYSADVHRAVKAIIAMKPDLVISTGDMVAGQRRPHLSEKEVKSMWTAFHAAVTDPLSEAGIPLAVTPGNHDGSAYSGFEMERRIYSAEWRARRPDLRFVGPDTYPFFYAFDFGSARFVSLDATTVGRLDPDQMQALETAFEDAGPARIVFSHLPLWPFAVRRETEIIGDPGLEVLLERQAVDLHLSGHHHAYYPGHLDRFAVISQAELGGGSRRLIGSQIRPPRAFTLLEIDDEGSIRATAFQAPDFREPIDITKLPKSLNVGDRVIRRIDTVQSGAVEMLR
ncbi:metallophosphoesterase family protein [Aestuariivita boseongensis]|uniref:metallophosphoesterase family protein n=1 Tax=Aestuariivita boseongensis TaxID=1470562 RepID=UPI000681FC0D|nr:metallophosphoesterase [Aestuariivita boseongensis]